MSRSCPGSSVLFINLMIIENGYNFTNSWIASFTGKIMYRKGQKRKDMSAFYLLTFYGPLWWECSVLFFHKFWRYIIFQACRVLEQLQSSSFFLLSGNIVLREVKLQVLCHKNYLKWGKSAKVVCLCIYPCVCLHSNLFSPIQYLDRLCFCLPLQLFRKGQTVTQKYN